MGIRRKVLAVVIIIAVIGGVIAAAFFLGLLGAPTAGVQDHGDWGSVSDDRTEVITSVWVQNPNPLGVKIGDSVEVSYQLSLNEVNVANGEKSGIEIEPGNNTVRISTFIQNDALSPWWVAFVQNNETIPLRVNGSVHVSAGTLSTTVDFPSFQRTLLPDSTPVITSLSEGAAVAEGTYTESLDLPGRQVAAGYEVQRGWATWGEINQDTSTVLFHFRVHNPGDVGVPAVPDGLGASIDMNNITMFRAQSDEFSLRNIDGDSIIRPGQTQEVVLEVQMDNSKIDDWFKSHVQNGEQTQIRTRLQLVFTVEQGGQALTFRIPEDSGPAYTCQLQTDILVDDQETATNCGQPSSVSGVESSSDTSEESSDGTRETDRPDRLTATVPMTPTITPPIERSTVTPPERPGSTPISTPTPTPTSTPTPTPTSTPTPTPTPTPASNHPEAQASATPTDGEAPLDVTFDASGSSDPDDDIERYVWRFKDATPPADGETVTHTFRSAGNYEVELLVIDSQGNEDTDTVRVTVEPRVG
jgi:LEA14-like dessication related protein